MSTRPTPPTTISTPRLHLIRLTDTSPGSQHVQWFHENWSDHVATGWRYRPHLPVPSSYFARVYPQALLLTLKFQSLRGATKSLDESQAWMVEHMEKYDNWFYSIFLRTPSSPSLITQDTRPDELGEHIGSVSLRYQDFGPTLPPPRNFDAAEEVGNGGPLTEEEMKQMEKDLEAVDLNLRVLGYALFEKFHGKGFVTEACKALIDGYAEEIGKWKASESAQTNEKEVVFYLEAGVDQDNPGSQKVLRKLGFKTVAMKIEKEKAWLNGGWRGPGWWITGKYLQ